MSPLRTLKTGTYGRSSRTVVQKVSKCRDTRVCQRHLGHRRAIRLRGRRAPRAEDAASRREGSGGLRMSRPRKAQDLAAASQTAARVRATRYQRGDARRRPPEISDAGRVASKNISAADDDASASATSADTQTDSSSDGGGWRSAACPPGAWSQQTLPRGISPREAVRYGRWRGGVGWQ